MPVPRQTVDGYLLQLAAVDHFCFIHHGADAASSMRWCRDNGGVPVDPGADIATHLNVVASAAGPLTGLIVARRGPSTFLNSSVVPCNSQQVCWSLHELKLDSD